MENVSDHHKIVEILEDMLAKDETITARAIARRHPTLTHASSITRNEERAALLASYQDKQREFRSWQGKKNKLSGDDLALKLAEKDQRIKELEKQVEVLKTSHVAMIRAVGEAGGMAKLLKFYNSYEKVQKDLKKIVGIDIFK